MTVPGYQSAFQAAMANARGNITQQLQAALGDIQSRQGAAGQALATLPGQVNASFDQAANTTNNALSAITAAQQKSGMSPLMDLKAYVAPEQAAVQGTRQADLANVPLLDQGIRSQANSMRQQANMGALGDMNQINQTEASGNLQIQLAQQQQAAQEAMARMQMQGQMASQQSANQFTSGQNDKQNMFTASQNQAQNAARLREIAAQQAGGNNPLDTTFFPQGTPLAGTGLSMGSVQRLRSDPKYVALTNIINQTKQSGNNQAGVLMQIGAKNPELLQLLIAENPDYFKGAQVGPARG